MLQANPTTRHPRATRWLRAFVATGLALLILNGVFGAVAHVILVDHVYCETHQEVEHDGDHDVASDDASTTVVAHTDVPADHDDVPVDEQSCELHMWLSGASVPLPDVHASLLDLPPPAEGLELAIQHANTVAYTPIDTLHVSPGLSPPSGLV